MQTKQNLSPSCPSQPLPRASRDQISQVPSIRLPPRTYGTSSLVSHTPTNPCPKNLFPTSFILILILISAEQISRPCGSGNRSLPFGSYLRSCNQRGGGGV
ncbi:hypothetical protein BO99DRAFT_223946 [Aspergillus violaceofuscus CBS 115571]|uniref:Uncharacterized protein n=1 Tax=Aspergillus violaceofuscus (strain CBS 115571) TaxID=1450538 RepID=A0A2V5IGS6_ASPV1|nr:hypothetical protein BO99DRAFT_223946 [Aspergillus violaceofuscus CBS 115571]